MTEQPKKRRGRPSQYDTLKNMTCEELHEQLKQITDEKESKKATKQHKERKDWRCYLCPHNRQKNRCKECRPPVIVETS